jgi:hypothetical protein
MTALALMELASRKLEQAKIRAQLAVLRWKNAIEAVENVNGQTQNRLELPKTITDSVAIAEQELKTADYLLTLSIENDALVKEKEVLGTAIQILELRSTQESKTLRELRQDMENYQEEYNRRLQAISLLESIPTPSFSSGIIKGVKWGLISLVVSLPIIILSNLVGPGLVQVILVIIILILMGVFLFGWLVVPILQSIRHKNEKKRAFENYASSKNHIVREYDDRVKKARELISHAEENLRSTQNALKQIRSHGG